MNLIVAVDKNWAIGYKGKLLASIRADQMNFKRLTLGKVVVLGRKTIETFPGGRSLSQRRNIILSRNPAYTVKDAEVVHSKEELLELIVKEKINSDDIFIIGGESLYREFLPLCDTDPRLFGHIRRELLAFHAPIAFCRKMLYNECYKFPITYEEEISI